MEKNYFPRQLEANTTCGPCDRRNLSRCYVSDRKCQSESTLSTGSNGNCGMGSRYRTSGCQILEIYDFACQLEANTTYGPCYYK